LEAKLRATLVGEVKPGALGFAENFPPLMMTKSEQEKKMFQDISFRSKAQKKI
jgi:hypothetical protein